MASPIGISLKVGKYLAINMPTGISSNVYILNGGFPPGHTENIYH